MGFSALYMAPPIVSECALADVGILNAYNELRSVAVDCRYHFLRISGSHLLCYVLRTHDVTDSYAKRFRPLRVTCVVRSNEMSRRDHLVPLCHRVEAES